jgi:hypothetical protein
MNGYPVHVLIKLVQGGPVPAMTSCVPLSLSLTQRMEIPPTKKLSDTVFTVAFPGIGKLSSRNVTCVKDLRNPRVCSFFPSNQLMLLAKYNFGSWSSARHIASWARWSHFSIFFVISYPLPSMSVCVLSAS